MTPETVVRAADGCVTERVGAEAVVWLTAERTLHLLDPAGALVWGCIEGPTTVADLALRVAGLVEGDPARVRADVLDFLTMMAERSLIVREGGGTGDEPIG